MDAMDRQVSKPQWPCENFTQRTRIFNMLIKRIFKRRIRKSGKMSGSESWGGQGRSRFIQDFRN